MSRIFGQRRRAGDEGFSLIEAVIALSIAMLVLVALLGTISTLTVTEVANRTRANATAIGGEMIERARALSFTKLAVLDDGTLPASGTYTVNGTAYQIVKGTPCPGCLPYKQTRTVRGVDYSITQLVLSRSTYTNADGNAVTAKQIVVDVTWTKPRSAHYSIQTVVNDKTPVAAPVIQGLRVEAHDDDDALIEDDAVSFNVSITGASSLTGTTEDGTWLNANLPVGSYTCTVSTNATSATYYVKGSPGVRTVSKTCNVTANTITVSTSQWTDSSECPTATGNGALTVNVADANGAALNGAAVALTRQSDSAAITPVSNTNSSGAVTYSGLVDGRYTYSVSKAGYTSPVTGSACVFANLTGSSDVTMIVEPSPGPSPTSTASPAATTATLQVSVTRKTTGGKDYVIRLTNATVGTIDRPIYVGQGCTGTVTFTGLPFGSGYTVTIFEKASDGKLNKKHDWTNQSLTSPSPPYTLSWTTGSGTMVCAA